MRDSQHEHVEQSPLGSGADMSTGVIEEECEGTTFPATKIF